MCFYATLNGTLSLSIQVDAISELLYNPSSVCCLCVTNIVCVSELTLSLSSCAHAAFVDGVVSQNRLRESFAASFCRGLCLHHEGCQGSSGKRTCLWSVHSALSSLFSFFLGTSLFHSGTAQTRDKWMKYYLHRWIHTFKNVFKCQWQSWGTFFRKKMIIPHWVQCLVQWLICPTNQPTIKH